MATVLKSVIVPHSCATMFELVDDVTAYPQFLPWCERTEVLEDGPELMRARLHIDYHGLRTQIATRNEKRAPHWIALGLLDGPFERFHGEWRFIALGDQGCRVEFALDYALSAGGLERLLGPAFGHIVETLVERFVERAERCAPPAGA